jgi:hypothetical protein
MELFGLQEGWRDGPVCECCNLRFREVEYTVCSGYRSVEAKVDVEGRGGKSVSSLSGVI